MRHADGERKIRRGREIHVRHIFPQDARVMKTGVQRVCQPWTASPASHGQRLKKPCEFAFAPRIQSAARTIHRKNAPSATIHFGFVAAHEHLDLERQLFIFKADVHDGARAEGTIRVSRQNGVLVYADGPDALKIVEQIVRHKKVENCIRG